MTFTRALTIIAALALGHYIALSLPPGEAHSQAGAPGTTFRVVATCGTVTGITYVVGQNFPGTVDVNGNLCFGDAGGSGVVTGSQSNASSAVATSATNVGTIAYNYGFNGTTWDQLQVDASKFLKMTVSAALPAGAAIIGKVGIDQTTPGTTDGVATALSAVTGSVSAKTITNSSAQVLAAASRLFLAVDNESTTATIACAFGATAAINTAGSFTIQPNQTRVWNSYPVPADALNCISSAATSAATVEAN